MIYDVPDYTWVKLAQAAESVNISHRAGDTCSLLKGGNVEVVGTDPKLGTLVRYSIPRGETAAGALCPNGALVFLPPEVVRAWPGEGVVNKQMADENAERAAAVERLLALR